MGAEGCYYRFLKGAFHEWSSVLAVDSMTSDGHQVATACHSVTQESQMPIIDIRTIKGDDMVKFSLQGLPYSLNAQYLSELKGRVKPS